jgi:hypothetical protein
MFAGLVCRKMHVFAGLVCRTMQHWRNNLCMSPACLANFAVPGSCPPVAVNPWKLSLQTLQSVSHINLFRCLVLSAAQFLCVATKCRTAILHSKACHDGMMQFGFQNFLICYSAAAAASRVDMLDGFFC